MAKVKGVVSIVGTIGGVNFYFRKGELIARKAGGGFNGKAIKKSPTMKRVREQNNEFANCSAVNKAFKLALRPILEGYVDGTLHSRLMSFFLKVKTLDAESKRGERQVAKGIVTTFGRKLLKDFVFTPKHGSLLPAQLSFDWNTFSLHVNGFDVSWIKFPQQADYLEVKLQLVRFDFNTLQYHISNSSTQMINRGYTGNSFSLTAIEPEGTSGLLFAVARVSFYQTVNGNPYLLAGDGALGVSVVSVKN